MTDSSNDINEKANEQRHYFISNFFSQINHKITDEHRNEVKSGKYFQFSHTLWLIFWALIIGTIVAILYITDTFYISLEITTIGFFVIVTLEYLLVSMSLRENYSTISEKDKIGSTPKIIVSKNIALLIPCGYGLSGKTFKQAEDLRKLKMNVITETLNSALLTFKPEDIFVIHNSNDIDFPDNLFAEILKDKANYCPLSIGSKSIAIYYSALLLKAMNYDLVLAIDDDVRLPSNFGRILSLIPIEGAGFACAIKATHANSSHLSAHSLGSRLLVSLQTCEYSLSDLSKILQTHWSPTGSVLSPHGAISIWRTSTLIEIMRRHNALFDGEDYQMGIILRRMGKSNALRYKFLSNIVTETVVPESVFDLFYQRKNSWDLAAAQFLLGGCCGSRNTGLFCSTFWYLPCNAENLIHRGFLLLDIWTALQDYLRVFLLFLHLYTATRTQTVNILVLTLYVVTIAIQYIICLILIRVKLSKREDLEMRETSMVYLTIFSFPFYRYLMSFVRVVALMRFLFNYGAIKRNAVPICEMKLPMPEGFRYLNEMPFDINAESNQKVLFVEAEEAKFFDEQEKN